MRPRSPTVLYLNFGERAHTTTAQGEVPVSAIYVALTFPVHQRAEALMRWPRFLRLSPLLAGIVLVGALTRCADESTSPALTESLLLPSDAATVEGNSANVSPFRDVPARFQSVYGASLLGLPVGAKITGMRFRLDGSETRFTNVTISNFEVRLSTSTSQPGSLSSTFAANRGADEVIVRTGPLTIAPNDYPIGSMPNAFGPTIQFSRPFVYKGGPLLLEIGYTGVPGPDLHRTDAVFPATAESESGYGAGGGFNSTIADVGLFQDLIVVEYQFVRP